MLKVKLIKSSNRNMEEKFKDKEVFFQIVPNHFILTEKENDNFGATSSRIRKITIETLNSTYEFERVEE
jgi:hypothetical protein